MSPPRVPLYLQIVDTLIERIEHGDPAPGERMATERALAEEFGVNRRTLRQALDVLERRGLVERVQGSGTFVRQPRLERGASEFFHFTERVRELGSTAGSTTLSLERTVASPAVAKELELTGDGEIYRCHRLRTVNGQPVMVETFSLPAELVPEFESYDVAARSVYEIMRTEYGIEVAYARQSLEAVALSEIEAQWLGGTPGAPAMLERRLAFDDRGRPVDYGTDLYRGDRVRFVTGAATVAVPLGLSDQGSGAVPDGR